MGVVDDITLGLSSLNREAISGNFIHAGSPHIAFIKAAH